MTSHKSSFDRALHAHLDSIKNRDIEKFRAHITKDKVMYTIVQNGHAFKTTQELISMHEDWFKDPNWVWEGTIVHKVVGEDMAFALIKYDYRAKKEDKPFSSWLTYVFRLEDNEWRIVHDHSTALDFHTFLNASGMNE